MSEMLSSEYVLPFGDDLRIFLTQDLVAESLLKRILRHRGIFLPTSEKKDMLPYFLLSFLSPDEFELMLDSIKTKEDSRKMRTASFTVACPNPNLSDMMPIELDVHQIAADPYGNSQIIGTPVLADDPTPGAKAYVLRYRVERLSHSSDWISGRRVFDGEIRFELDRLNKFLKVTTFHTAIETEKANRRLTQYIERDMRVRKMIGRDDAIKITFGSFTNAQRILFFMKFTALNEDVGLVFKKFSDLALKLDDSVPSPDEERLNWMRDKVSTVKLKGEALQDTFFVKDLTCRPYIIMWRVDAQYTFSTVDETGHFTATLEFADYGISQKRECEFQISIPALTIGNKQQGHPDCFALKRQFLVRLNEEKDKAFAAAVSATSPVVKIGRAHV